MSRKWTDVITNTRLIGAAVAVLMALSGVQLYLQDRSTDRLNTCVASYSEGFSRALDSRSEATQDYQDKLTEVMRKVAQVVSDTPDPNSRVQLQASVEEFLDSVDRAKQVRVENPYPDPPSEFCQEVR